MTTAASMVIIKTPKDYSNPTRAKMIEAGLSKIELDFSHTETQGYFGESRYFFNDGKITNDPKVYRKKVFKY